MSRINVPPHLYYKCNMHSQSYLQTTYVYMSNCEHFFSGYSEQDPSGLLFLPDADIPTDFEIGQVLSVMEKLLSMAVREVAFLLYIFYVYHLTMCWLGYMFSVGIRRF